MLQQVRAWKIDDPIEEAAPDMGGVGEQTKSFADASKFFKENII
jgi:hypothetical protein